MAASELRLLAGRLKLRYFAKGAAIITPDSGAVQEVYIIQRGAVEGTPVVFPSYHPTAVTLGPGESFPIGALIGKRATTLRYAAAADTFCYVLAERDFHAVMAASQAFHWATWRIVPSKPSQMQHVQLAAVTPPRRMARNTSGDHADTLRPSMTTAPSWSEPRAISPSDRSSRSAAWPAS